MFRLSRSQTEKGDEDRAAETLQGEMGNGGGGHV